MRGYLVKYKGQINCACNDLQCLKGCCLKIPVRQTHFWILWDNKVSFIHSISNKNWWEKWSLTRTSTFFSQTEQILRSDLILCLLWSWLSPLLCVSTFKADIVFADHSFYATHCAARILQWDQMHTALPYVLLRHNIQIQCTE